MIVHILVDDQATPLCGEALDDGDRTVSWAHRSEATCDDCLSEAWKRHVRERVPLPGDTPLDDDGTFPDDAPARPQLEQLFAKEGAALLRALFAWRDQEGRPITRWATKPSRRLGHLADQLALRYSEATSELRRAGRDDAIEATVKRIQTLSTAKGRAWELMRIREDLAAAVGDLDAIAGYALDAAEESEELGPSLEQRRREAMAGVQKDERPEVQTDDGTEGRPVLSFAGHNGSVKFTPVSGGIGIVWQGKPKTICITHEDAGLLATWLGARGYQPKPPDPIFSPATLHQAGDFLLARFLLSNPTKLPSTTTVLELLEWSHAQPPVPLPIRPPPLPRTRELLRRFAHDWRESEKDPANGGGKIDVDLLTEVCDAFEAEDRS